MANILEMRGFVAQVEVLGRAILVEYRDKTMTFHDIALATAHDILTALAKGKVDQEVGDSLSLEEKKAATGEEHGRTNNGKPPKPNATPKPAPKPAQPKEPTDSEVAASMREELESDAIFDDDPDPENLCGECGNELGVGDGTCGACTEFEDRGRAVTRKVREVRSNDRAKVPQPGNKKHKLHRDSGVRRIPEADDPLAPEGGVPEKIMTATRLRAVLGYMLDHGFETEEDIIQECKRIQFEVPVMARVVNLEERIRRTLQVMDTDSS